jgi:hypothetical protein
MPLLIGLLIFFGCAAIGSFMGSGAVTVIALVFTAPGFICEKLYPEKHISKAEMFLVDVAVWFAVFFTLYLCGKLTFWNITGAILASFVIGIIGWFGYIVFGFDERVKVNCTRCGKPFSRNKYNTRMLCRACQEQYDELLQREIQRQPTKVNCGACSGSGKNRGYKCVQCNGRGSFARTTDDIEGAARHELGRNCSPEWKEILTEDGSVRGYTV